MLCPSCTRRGLIHCPHQAIYRHGREGNALVPRFRNKPTEAREVIREHLWQMVLDGSALAITDDDIEVARAGVQVDDISAADTAVENELTRIQKELNNRLSANGGCRGSGINAGVM